MDEKMQENLLNYLISDKNNRGDLTKTEEKILENVLKAYKKDITGMEKEAYSDIYGGVTDNAIVGNYSHTRENYWYDENGNATGAQAVELWAEYYSYCMTGNEEAMENLREHFPNAAKFLDKMAESMASKRG